MNLQILQNLNFNHTSFLWVIFYFPFNPVSDPFMAISCPAPVATLYETTYRRYHGFLHRGTFLKYILAFSRYWMKFTLVYHWICIEAWSKEGLENIWQIIEITIVIVLLSNDKNIISVYLFWAMYRTKNNIHHFFPASFSASLAPSPALPRTSNQRTMFWWVVPTFADLCS